MAQMRKYYWPLWVGLVFVVVANSAYAMPAPEADKVIQHGLPEQPEALVKTTQALFQEFVKTKNVTSLIFYSYGMLRQANHFSAINDFIHASEYAKTGFFYLDEAVDSHEENPRIRYLRARIDAYLPAVIGRCVVTLDDTERLLKEKNVFEKAIVEHIEYMRYRALVNCNQHQQAELLMEKIKTQTAVAAKFLSPNFHTEPEWDTNEVSQVVIPLLKGE
ncbi:hypothetical protein BBB57_06425 [Kosakonia sacchari]|uniref:hypothetical protein n=1 Tax=Kosakonia sacchari TaxID=1158459 RepID=UPI000807362C|nr:hypothetical protein [Kosakonia sacchari]ANR77928.1 hypothetical protein BBB57_06425 [Kosakonia sacchari]